MRKRMNEGGGIFPSSRSRGSALQGLPDPFLARGRFCGEVREAKNMGRSKEPKGRQIEAEPGRFATGNRWGENK